LGTKALLPVNEIGAAWRQQGRDAHRVRGKNCKVREEGILVTYCFPAVWTAKAALTAVSVPVLGDNLAQISTSLERAEWQQLRCRLFLSYLSQIQAMVSGRSLS